MKIHNTLTAILVLIATTFTFAQSTPDFNTTLVGNLQYADDVNDIWGYVAPDGTEYALVGLRNGVSVVSLATPSAPDEKAYVGGASSLWRDLKTWGDYAYITNETSNGIMILDLTGLPGGVSASNFIPTVDLGMEIGTLNSAHNLYIDEFGYMYVVGSDLNAGGAIIFDLTANPTNPPYVGKEPAIYSHDIFVRNNRMFTSDIYAGVFSVYDVSDKSNITFLGSQTTPFLFTHNTWLSDDGNTLFTTDERADAPVGSYDISDLNDIQKLDEYRPIATVGLGVIPHNVHVLNDYLVISHYTDGVVFVDAARPQNMIEVAQYDTWSGGDGGFNGCWGAYPFLPSGLILASDQTFGLHVINATMQRGCYLEGLITDFQSGSGVQGATVEIQSTPVSESSDIIGEYRTGFATAGTYDVVYAAPGYISQTISVSLLNGQLTIQDVVLEQAPSFLFTGQVKDAATGTGIAGAKIEFENETYFYQATSNSLGNFGISMFGDTYTMTSGSWGYETIQQTGIEINEPQNFLVELDKGIIDPFALDLGWTVTGDASTGMWTRGDPVGTTFNNEESNPENDIDSDVGLKAYITGNGGGGGGTDDVDDGSTLLTSPSFDVTDMNEARVSYYLWFRNAGGNGNVDDMLEVKLSNGTETVVIETVTSSGGFWRPISDFLISDFLTPTNDMSIIFETGDLGSGHIVEAGVDVFRAYDGDPLPTGIANHFDDGLTFEVFPSPFQNSTLINYDLDEWNSAATSLVVSNVLGQTVETRILDTQRGELMVGEGLETGIYIVRILSGNKVSRGIKVTKIK